jgi:hypothetical protein
MFSVDSAALILHISPMTIRAAVLRGVVSLRDHSASCPMTAIAADRTSE